MREAIVLYKGREAGVLIQDDDASFHFRYTDEWLNNSENPSISLRLPKEKRAFHAKYLFPFFYNMLPEGSNRQAICKYHKIDRQDDFGLLMVSAENDSIGAIRIAQKS